MSATQYLQSGFPLEMWQPFGNGKMANSAAPTNGFVGAAPGCEYINLLTGATFKNVGTSASAIWVEADPFAATGTLLGGGVVPTTSQAVMAASGNVYRRFLAAAGISPSATGADKIVDAFTVPANSFDAAGRGIVITVTGKAAANGNNREFKVILGATNSPFPAIDGTVTVTGGTTIGDTGVLTTNNGTIILSCQIFKRGAAASNTQNSQTTAIIGGSTHSGAGAYTDQTFTESSALLLAITAQATTTATDIVYQSCEITGFN